MRARPDIVLPACLVFLAIVLRLGWVLAVPTRPVGDFAMYMESAAYLLDQGHLDPTFVYMPGYVYLLAAVQALGGGLLAAKLAGVALGGLGAAAVWGVTARIFDRRAAAIATALYAVWPAGVAVTSVTGTDMPAAVLLVSSLWCLVRWGPSRPLVAAAAFGLGMGLAATVRAVALPLAVLSAGYWMARRAPAAAVTGRTALALVVSLAVLSPWAVRNRLRHDELFFTDSHGGHTALVGSNPNSDGVYTRSLNHMFTQATGFKLLAEPHRPSDRAAYALARAWAGFQPAFALGLVAAKADRLLTRERGVLYWPIYRQGVLPRAESAWFADRRGALDALADGFWFVLVGASLAGLGVALVRRHREALSLVPFQAAMIGIYVLFFAEPRYHLPIAVLAFPLAGSAMAWLASRQRGRREAAAAILLTAVVFAGWPALLRGGERLRGRHRWAVVLCDVAGARQLCKWRRATAEGPSPVRGCSDALGLRLPAATPVGEGVAAETEIALPAGRYRLRGTAEPPSAPHRAGFRLDLEVGGRSIASATLLPDPHGSGARGPLDGTVQHGGGALRLTARARVLGGELAEAASLWLSDLTIEPAAAESPGS